MCGLLPLANLFAAPGVTPMMVRLSNILSVESRPFDPDTHALETETYYDEAGQRQVRAASAALCPCESCASACPERCAGAEHRCASRT